MFLWLGKLVVIDGLKIEGNVVSYSGGAAALSRDYLEQVNSIEQFVSFNISSNDAGRVTIEGELGRFNRPLNSFIGAPVETSVLCSLIRSMYMLLETCGQKKMLLKCLALRGDVVFYSEEDNEFKFIYLPFTDIAPQNENQLLFFKSFGNLLLPKDEAAKEVLRDMGTKLETVTKYNPAALLRIYKETNADLSVLPKEEGTTVLDPICEEEKPDQDQLPIPKQQPKAEANPLEPSRDVPPTGVLNPLSIEQATILSANKIAEDPIGQHSKRVIPKPDEPPASDSPKMAPGTTVLNSVSIGGVNEVPEWGDPPHFDDVKRVTNERRRDVPNETQERAIRQEVERVAKWRLFLTRERTGERFEVRGDDFIVGKSMNASFQVYDTTTVSRMHARFTVREDGCWVSDLNSKNGSFVESVRMQRGATKQLHHGDIVRLSDERFRVEIEDAQKSRA